MSYGVVLSSEVGRAHILLVGGRRDIHERLRYLTDAGVTLMIRQGKRQPGDSDLYDSVIEVDPSPSSWLDHAVQLHRRRPITHVMAFHEFNVEHAAAIAERLGLPFHSSATVAAIRDKQRMRELLPPRLSPRWRPAEDDEEVRRAVEELGTPCVVKPVSGSGSEDVQLIRGPGITPARIGGPSVVEVLVAGREVSVEAFTEDGTHHIIGLTEKFHFAESAVERGHLFPLELPAGERALLVKVVREALDSLGVERGPTHTEVILTATRPVVIETHLRPGGDRFPEMIADVTGVSIVDLWIRQNLGDDVAVDIPTAPWPSLTFSCCWYRGAEEEGVLTHVSDTTSTLRSTRALGHDVRSLELRVAVGDRVRPPQRSADRILIARATGPTAHRAREAARHALERVQVQVEPGRESR